MENDKYQFLSSQTLPVGDNDFRSIVEQGLDFVDKTLLIKEIMDSGDKVILIPRPRRFGKTFNMSMLQCFFASMVRGKPTKGVFDKLKIAKIENYLQQYQGKYPVIFLTFKDVRGSDFQSTYEKLRQVMAELYRDHYELLDSNALIEEEKRAFKDILSRVATKEDVESALKALTTYLYRHHGVEPIVLIDEYDTPIHAGFTNKYYDKIVECMKSILSPALKDNPYMRKGVLTGIMRVSKESLFTGLNNVTVYSLLESRYSEYFGFTEAETRSLLERRGMENLAEDIKNWYNGYMMGNNIIYNPWSIVNCISKNGMLQPYWVHTSDNALIRDLLVKTSIAFKSQFEFLLQGKAIEKVINENIVFNDLQADEDTIWSLLLMTGYLKIVSKQLTLQEGASLCKLEIPNREIRSLYRDIIIKSWLSADYKQYDQFLNSFIQGNIEGFKEHLNKMLLQTASTFDMAMNPEAFYHGFMLGLLADLNPAEYEVKSNRESGYGRYDIMVMPKTLNRLAILLEIKNVKELTGKQDINVLLDEMAKEGLKQMSERQYTAELEQRNVSTVLRLGLAFYGKLFKIEHDKIQF